MEHQAFDVATAPLMSDEQVDALMDALHLEDYDALGLGAAVARRFMLGAVDLWVERG